MTLRQRLLAFNLTQILGSFVLLVILTLMVMHFATPMLREHLVYKTTTTATSLAMQLDVALATEDDGLAQGVLASVLVDPDFGWLEVVNSEQKIILQHGARPADLVFQEAPGVAQAVSNGFAAWAPIKIEGLRLGTIGVSFHTHRIDRFSLWMWFFVLVVGAVFVVATSVAVRFIRTFVAPLSAMMEFSKRVAAGELGERLSCCARGELGELVTHLNVMAAGLQEREAQLQKRQQELSTSLETLRKTQNELLESTRLASVGEMAGRTAHEVLNPITSIDGRIARMCHLQDQVYDANLQILGDIVEGWSTAFQKGGLDELCRSLQRRIEDGSGQLLVDEDIKNLEGIHGFLVKAGEQTKDSLQFLRREVARVTRIIDGMRSLTRQSSSRALLPVRAILDESVEVVQDSLSKRNITVSLEYVADPMVVVDRYELVQIMTNLLRNAMMAIEEQSGREGGTIGLGVAANDHHAEIRVRDCGTGIKEEHLPYIFESGFTTRDAASGTGLGLGIARRLARGFGGDITVEETRLGHGTTFLIQLPVQAPDAMSPRAEEVADAGP